MAHMNDSAPPVLDLRPNTAFHADRLDQMLVGGPNPRLHRSSVLGYEVQAQWSKRRGMHEGVTVRLSAPDGRVLNVAGPRHTRAKDAADAVARCLSPMVRRAVRNQKRTDALREEMAATIERVITEGRRCLVEGVAGTPALIRVGAAAEQVDPVQVLSFDVFAPLQESLLAAGDVTVPQIATLIRCGFTRETAIEWFGKNLKVPDESTVKAYAAFRDAGWSLEHVRVAEGYERGFAMDAADRDGVPYQHPKASVVWGLVALTWEEALLAMSAGVPAKAAVRLKRSGEWNEAALNTVAALRRDLVWFY
jgi:hypothetical protein